MFRPSHVETPVGTIACASVLCVNRVSLVKGIHLGMLRRAATSRAAGRGGSSPPLRVACAALSGDEWVRPPHGIVVVAVEGDLPMTGSVDVDGVDVGPGRW
jgi:hypothetical protein